DSVIDAAVARVLRAKLELGLFEDPYVDPDSAAYWNGHADHRALAREAARAALVLLRNDRNVLPLSSRVASITVIGTDAVEARLGGYSGPGVEKVSILDGIRARAGNAATVRYAPGPGRVDTTYVVVSPEHLRTSTGGEPGLTGEYFANNTLSGEPVLVRTDERIDMRWTLSSPARGIPFDWYSVRWTGRLIAPEGVRRIGVEGNDGYRLWLDGRLLIDNWRKQSYGTRLADLVLEPGRAYDLRLEFFESTGNARVRLVWDAGVVDSSRARVDRAVSLARTSDVAIV